MTTPIPGLSGTATHQLGIQMFQAHHDNGDGVCAHCGRHTPCPQRRNAADLIVSAGDDPRRYEPSRPASYRRSGPQHEGFHVRGRGRPPLGSAGYQYERDHG